MIITSILYFIYYLAFWIFTRPIYLVFIHSIILQEIKDLKLSPKKDGEDHLLDLFAQYYSIGLFPIISDIVIFFLLFTVITITLNEKLYPIRMKMFGLFPSIRNGLLNLYFPADGTDI